MNALTIELGLMQWDETDAINALQEHGIISDCAVSAEDVAPGDAMAAVEWLRENRRLWKQYRAAKPATSPPTGSILPGLVPI